MNNSSYPCFDLPNAGLSGTQLIEASAGTGKTYTITGLFLRLVLERDLPVEQILVVTFTEAATSELKERIRLRLKDALTAFSQKDYYDDKLLQSLLEKVDHNRAISKLTSAIRDFDQAAIFTIHGFCRRMLMENAFESGSLFDMDLLKDEDSLKLEIVEDFWRKNLYNTSVLFVDYVMQNTDIRELLILSNNAVSKPGLCVIPKTGELFKADSDEKEFMLNFAALAGAWPSDREEVENLLMTDKGLNRNKYQKKSIPGWIPKMDEYVRTNRGRVRIFEEFYRFCQNTLDASVKKNCQPPLHSFFSLCEKLHDSYNALEEKYKQRLLKLKIDLFDYMETELANRKEKLHVLSFDDLLNRMHRAISDETGLMTENVGKKYKAALIDEFQDTDPIQYDIFSSLFKSSESVLFLIGDPKQAIYAFRGADIFAYMKAARNADHRFTLDKNWRSEPGLINAVNKIFANSANPFVYDDISFQSVVPADLKEKRKFLTVEGEKTPGFHLWFIPGEESGKKEKAITKTIVNKSIPKTVAAEISFLLQQGREQKAMIGDEPVKEGDIAVLVYKNKESELIQKALADLNIPSVRYSTGNLFDTFEAEEFLRLLYAVSEPDNERRVRAALCTDMIGLSGEQLDLLSPEEGEFESWIIKLRQYSEIWKNNGFIRMFREFIFKEKILIRLISFVDGERRITNLLHLAEVLHQAGTSKKLGMFRLVRYLFEQIDPIMRTDTEQLMRLESDENAIRLVTVHKSKGLEYPIVFCPFAWSNLGKKKSVKALLFHDRDEKLTLDLGSEDINENKKLAEKENLAENARLLYVALTRAKHRCYLVWGKINDTTDSALCRLLHPTENSPDIQKPGKIGEKENKDLLETQKNHMAKMSSSQMLDDLKILAEKAGSNILVSQMPEEPGRVLASPDTSLLQTFDYMRFDRSMDLNPGISSFSALLSGHTAVAEIADYDAQPVSPKDEFLKTDEEEERTGIFAFPRGRGAGTCLHDIFEHLDFTCKNSDIIQNLLNEKLVNHGFDEKWTDTVREMVIKVLSLPLGRKSEPRFSLSMIPKKERVDEMEFHFPLSRLTPDRLRAIFSSYPNVGSSDLNLSGFHVSDFHFDDSNFSGSNLPGFNVSGSDFQNNSPVDSGFPEMIGNLKFAPSKGYMKGYIDLLFRFNGRYYIIDWKSNDLGAKIEDYHWKNLLSVMKSDYYILQYHIYTLAVHQYLSLRIPDYDYDRHFGGIFYVFLRGVDPDKGMDYGIFKDRPPKDFVIHLKNSLIHESSDWHSF